MTSILTKQELLRLNKKQVLNHFGYRNIKEFCKHNEHMVESGRAPSRKTIIKNLA